MIRKTRTKLFSTNVFPNTKILVDGPCEIIVKKTNKFGQIELSFCVDQNVFVETFKIKKEETETK